MDSNEFQQMALTKHKPQIQYCPTVTKPRDMHMVSAIEKVIQNIGGQRIVTILTENGPSNFDIQPDGSVGYHATHAALLSVKLQRVMRGGSVIVRQFTDETEVVGDRTLPVKNLFGFVCNNGQFTAVPVGDLRWSMETDCETGQPLPREEAVRYLDYSLCDFSKPD